MNEVAVHLIFGPSGAGKTTFAIKLAEETRGVRFSIDEWMQELFGPDVPEPIELGWLMDRVRRCENHIWTMAYSVAASGGRVVLDLGFMKVADRARFTQLAQENGLSLQTHFISAPADVRRERVMARNVEQGSTFSVEVSPAMFDFAEGWFEAPTPEELKRARIER